MARIRTVKPELAKHSGLFDLETELGIPIRFAWVMLFTVCDREGRFKWRPRDLKIDILPHDNIDFSRVLDAWVTRGYLVKYRVGHEWFGWLPTFTEHQVINNREGQSIIPSIANAEEKIDNRNSDVDACGTRGSREDHADTGEGKGKEGKGKEPLLRVSDLAGMYQRYAGVNQCGGGVVPIFQAMIGKYTAEAIEEAFQAAAAANIETSKFLNWVRGRLERKKDAPAQAAKTEQGAGGYDPVTPEESRRIMEALRRARGDSPAEC